jgi:glucose-6-phosphate 1-dehydrogenase
MSDNSGAPGLEPAIIVIFGITGDLAQRKLLPALYHLIKDKLLHPTTQIVGLSRRPLSVDDLLSSVELCVLEQDNVCDPDALAAMRNCLSMVQLDPQTPADYNRLKTALDDIEQASGMCLNRLFYLAIPPSIYRDVVTNLGEQHLHEGCQHHTAVSRLLVEKPFGKDLADATALVDLTEKYFGEEQVFRIDHYLAKESVQNILTFRRHNPVFNDGWHGKYISQITVRAFEQIGVEGRGSFYDDVGALRDLVQSHLMQLLALVMVDIDTDNVAGLHDAKEHLLDSLRPIAEAPVVRGQYDGYREEVGKPESTTETYVSLWLESQLPKWHGARLLLETGKALRDKRTEIVLEFAAPGQGNNLLTFRIQPNEGIDLTLTAKKPGFEHQTQQVSMYFSYNGVFDEPMHPDAYERVLVDAERGDHSLFATSAEVLAAWRALQPILDTWAAGTAPQAYAKGSEGPEPRA